MRLFALAAAAAAITALAGTSPAQEKKGKVGPHEATLQDIRGTFLSKNPPFDPNAKVTRMEGYRQIYVIFETKDGVASLTLLGPDKTIEKHKKAFEEWLKNFK